MALLERGLAMPAGPPEGMVVAAFRPAGKENQRHREFGRRSSERSPAPNSNGAILGPDMPMSLCLCFCWKWTWLAS